MAPFINARPGYVNYALNEPVAANQTIRKGDLVKYDAAKAIVKAAIGDTTLLGFATHDITTGATPAETDRCIVDPFHSQTLTKGQVKNGVTVDRTLVNTTVGFIDEGGEIRLDPAATVKQARIVEVVDRGGLTTINNEALKVYFEVLLANRVRNT